MSAFYQHVLAVGEELLGRNLRSAPCEAAVDAVTDNANQSTSQKRAVARTVQSLWGGMGQVLRLSQGTSSQASIIVKFVDPPASAVNPDAVSDKEYRGMLRKLVSFHVEGGFYEHIVPMLASYDALFDTAVEAQRAAGISCEEAVDYDCKMPTCYRVESTPISSKQGKGDGSKEGYGSFAAQYAFFMEDLATAGIGYGQRRHPLTISSSSDFEIRDCLAWLASFHARSIKYLQEESGCFTPPSHPSRASEEEGAKKAQQSRDGPTNSSTDACYTFDSSIESMDTRGRAVGCGDLADVGGVALWRTGTYWHLSTRPDELQALQSTAGRDKTITRLGQFAGKIDERLSVDQLRYPCLLHGDPKVANFCFPSAAGYSKARRSRLAAVDFQYVGLGCGMRDVAYFLEGFNGYSSGDAEETRKHLDVYFDFLRKNLAILLPEQHPALASDIEAEWRPLYPFASADLSRFMCGWSGPYLDGGARANVEEALKQLS